VIAGLKCDPEILAENIITTNIPKMRRASPFYPSIFSFE
jgi:hypothetical protein